MTSDLGLNSINHQNCSFTAKAPHWVQVSGRWEAGRCKRWPWATLCQAQTFPGKGRSSKEEQQRGANPHCSLHFLGWNISREAMKLSKENGEGKRCWFNVFNIVYPYSYVFNWQQYKSDFPLVKSYFLFPSHCREWSEQLVGSLAVSRG